MKPKFPYLFLAVLTLLSGSRAAHAEVQTVQLQQSWNLFALYVTPTNPAVESVFSSLITSGRLVSLFSFEYEGTNGVWKRFYPNLPTERRWLNTLTTLRPFQGYWVNLTIAPQTTLSIPGQFSTNLQATTLQPGWNLIGLGNDRPVFWADGLGSVAGGIQALFAYDQSLRAFQGFRDPQFLNADINGDTDTKPNEFGWVYPSQAGQVRFIEPGQAVWVKVDGAKPFGPELEVEVESDVNPFLPGASTNRWFEPGIDTDINGNGRLDYGFTRVERNTGLPVYDQYGSNYLNTQDTIWFRVPTGAAHTNLAILRQDITILNYGSGFLHFEVETNQPWLVVSPTSGRVVQGVAGETVTLLADIAGLPPGEYSGPIRIRSNGGQKPYNVKLTVPGLGGIYGGDIIIAEVSGRGSIPRRWPVRLSYLPGGNSVLHGSGTPHLPGDLLLANLGSFTNFNLLGIVVMETNAPANPYGIRHERTIRLQGRRVNVAQGTIPGANLGLEGTYEETLTGLPGGPVVVGGRFLLNPVTDTSRLEEP